MQGNVNQLLSRCTEAGKWKENQWKSMKSSQLGSLNIRRREQEKETATECGERERERKFMQVWNKEKVQESAGKKASDNKWNDLPCEGLARVHSATWNYSTRRRLGWLLTEASGLADFPVRKMPCPIVCGETVTVTDASIICERSNSQHYRA